MKNEDDYIRDCTMIDNPKRIPKYSKLLALLFQVIVSLLSLLLLFLFSLFPSFLGLVNTDDLCFVFRPFNLRRNITRRG